MSATQKGMSEKLAALNEALESDSSSGSIVKLGTGTLALSRLNNTYTDEAGTLVFSGENNSFTGNAGAGTLVFSGALDPVSAIATVNINEGSLTASGVDILQGKNVQVLQNGILDLNNFDQHVLHLSGNGKINLGSANLTVKSSTFNGTFSGTGIVTELSTGKILYSGTDVEHKFTANKTL